MMKENDASNPAGLSENAGIEVDRRSFLAGMGAAGVALATGEHQACAGTGHGRCWKGSGDVVVRTWGGASTDAMKEVWPRRLPR